MKLPLTKEVIYTSQGNNSIVIKIDNNNSFAVKTMLLFNKEKVINNGLIGECIYKFNLKDGDTITAKASGDIDYTIKPQSDYTANKLEKFEQFDASEDKILAKELDWSSIMQRLESIYVLTKK